MECKLGPGQIGVWRLFIVQITLGLISRIDFYRMIADGPNGAKTRYGRSASAGGRHKTDSMVIPVNDPGALHCPPAQAGDLELNRCSDRSGSRAHLKALRYFDSVLCDGFSVDDRRNFVHSAVIFWNHKTRIETTAGVDVEFADRCRGFLVSLSFEMI